jgi:hypothetical protein
MPTSTDITDHAGPSELADRLCAALPTIAAVDITDTGGGYHALVHLDPWVVRARALQQGLPDASIARAARDPRVLAVVAAAVARVNADAPRGGRIIAHAVSCA